MINVVAEFERCGIPFEFSGEELRVCCPFHGDETPSCMVNPTKQVFKCHACDKDGDIATFLSGFFKVPRRVIVEDLNRRYNISNVKTIEISLVDRYHTAIWEATPLRKELYARGLSDETIRERRLGYNDGRIIIPVFDEDGRCVNIRKYLPGGPPDSKMKNAKRFGDIRLYPVDQLKFETIIICGGEVKALAVAQRLNANGIGAICQTGGESNWNVEFNCKFEGKKVYVCFDIDETGEEGSERVASVLARTAKSLHKIRLPLDRTVHPHGDVNDFIASGGDLRTLLHDEPWRPSYAIVANEEVRDVSLFDATRAENVASRLRLRAVVTTMDTTPYVVPKVVEPKCSRDQEFCPLCPVFPLKDGETLEIPAESPGILEMVAHAKKTLREATRGSLKMPPCKVVTFTPKSYHNVEDVRLSPPIELSSTAPPVIQSALVIGRGVEMNEEYRFTGRMYPHPKSQQSVLVMSEREAVSDALSSYEFADVPIFRPDEWSVEGIQAKLDDIYADLSANVTRIHGRQDLHLMIDLAYHSPLLLPIDRVTKGWVEVLIVGDSAQGKSESINRLMEFYRVGTKVDCKNATVAGLLGGLQQIGTRWFVTWGVIPTNDRRLVVLEELKGASVEVIAKLTDMRSSGVAEIPKIEKKRTNARTRLVAISNPRNASTLDSYSFGIHAIRELVGNLEDVRRFDAALLLSRRDVDLGVIQSRPIVEHRYDSESCRKAILNAWTCGPDRIRFESDAASFVAGITDRFSDAIPLVDRGSMRHKIARLGTALAARTASWEEGTLVVRRSHFEYIVGWLERIYSAPSFGYADFTRAHASANDLTDIDRIKKAIFDTPFPSDFVERLLSSDDIELRDISDWLGWDRTASIDLLSILVRRNALIRNRNGYRKNPEFISLLKSVREEAKAANRPAHIPEF